MDLIPSHERRWKYDGDSGRLLVVITIFAHHHVERSKLSSKQWKVQISRVSAKERAEHFGKCMLSDAED